jgi:sugar phosphate isomerase/epimerase
MLVASSLMPISLKPVDFHLDPEMLKIYATKWGVQESYAYFCKLAKDAGYDGIEIWAPPADKIDELKSALSRNGLRLGLLVGNSGKTFQEHMDSFRRSIDAAIILKPDFINCHAGKDYFSIEKNLKFIEYSHQVKEASGIPIYHETHRGRILYSIPIALQYLEQNPDLELTLDISHWCCVHESLLTDQQSSLDVLFPTVRHIHARVGFPEGPQIPDPTSTHYQKAIDVHFGWWDTLIRMGKEKGRPMTITTEFGPSGYMWTDPDTGKPLRNNWEMNKEMLQLFRKRYTKG